MLWAIILGPTVFLPISSELYLCFVYLFSVNLLSPDVGGRGYRNGFYPCLLSAVRPKTCVRNSS